ncbi:MAG TPA: DUF559 domain-containing protein [Microvirga sp.]|jgi:very-short-patch-repair endonuclease|nr:DUF559 domain-containing protein [Microvirga sp.]
MRGLRIPETRRSRDLRRDQTDAERKLWSKLRNRRLAGLKFVRQEPVGCYFVDFLCRGRRLVIEIDGATHSTDEEIASDARRTAFLEQHGFRVVRFTNAEVYENLEGVLETVLHVMQLSEISSFTDRPLTPTLSPRAGRGR